MSGRRLPDSNIVKQDVVLGKGRESTDRDLKMYTLEIRVEEVPTTIPAYRTLIIFNQM